MSERIAHLACPHPHRAPLVGAGKGLGCSDSACADAESAGGFLTFHGVPVLIDFSGDTVCERSRYEETESARDAYVARRPSALKAMVRRLSGGTSPVTRANCARFVAEANTLSPQPRILIIGSGERGQGTDALWDDPALERVGIDIYPSPTTDYIADAHALPFRAESFEGVWIQAVLQLVAEPARVVAEIERVLKPGGIVYAETAFMQQVHEGGYDYQRYTVTGHRFLFRRFEMLAIGGNQGPGVVLAWSLRYFLWGLLRSRRLAAALAWPFLVVLRLADRLVDQRALWDACSGVYFLGRKGAGEALPQRELPGLYGGFQR